jgi:uncharacterized protein YlxP (DUF503 family)
MVVGAARYDLRLPGSTSLKDKRSVLRGIGSMLQKKFSCAYAEVGSQDLRARASIGVAIVSGTHFHAKRVLGEIERHMDTYPGVEVIGAVEDIYTPEDWQ